MRHTMFKPAALLLLGSLCTMTSFAQKSTNKSTREETVILKRDKNSDRTVVEVRDGSVFVNGEEVVTVHDGNAKNIRKKVIIEDGDSRGPRVQAYSFNDDEDFRDMPAPRAPRRAMLGVLTDPTADKVVP